MMKCGHTANARCENGPCCVICAPKLEAYQAVMPPDLTKRMAICSYGNGAPVPSSLELAFFEHHPDGETDSYYCGCKGWD